MIMLYVVTKISSVSSATLSPTLCAPDWSNESAIIPCGMPNGFDPSNNPETCGSGLARDSGDTVCQENRVDTIASKPAPTGLLHFMQLQVIH